MHRETWSCLLSSFLSHFIKWPTSSLSSAVFPILAKLRNNSLLSLCQVYICLKGLIFHAWSCQLLCIALNTNFPCILFVNYTICLHGRWQGISPVFHGEWPRISFSLVSHCALASYGVGYRDYQNSYRIQVNSYNK